MGGDSFSYRLNEMHEHVCATGAVTGHALMTANARILRTHPTHDSMYVEILESEVLL